MLSARKKMDVVSAFRDVGTYRGAAEICGVDPKTVKQIVAPDQKMMMLKLPLAGVSVPI
jgi:hypothetical protein